MNLFSKRRREAPGFRDRREAGKRLAEMVTPLLGSKDPLVLGLPRGGVPVAFEIALALSAELDVFLVRKLGLPGQEELAIGAIASGGIRILNDELIRELHVSFELIEKIGIRESHELEQRERMYREHRSAVPIAGRALILVDDGLATGASMKAAATALRLQRPSEITVAVPVAAEETCAELRNFADRIVCAFTPAPFVAVGAWYEDFSQTTDEEVRRLLASRSNSA